jgi:hypothetical protein
MFLKSVDGWCKGFKGLGNQSLEPIPAGTKGNFEIKEKH